MTQSIDLILRLPQKRHVLCNKYIKLLLSSKIIYILYSFPPWKPGSVQLLSTLRHNIPSLQFVLYTHYTLKQGCSIHNLAGISICQTLNISKSKNAVYLMWNPGFQTNSVDIHQEKHPLFLVFANISKEYLLLIQNEIG